jgi:hypothetical protein
LLDQASSVGFRLIAAYLFGDNRCRLGAYEQVCGGTATGTSRRGGA